MVTLGQVYGGERCSCKRWYAYPAAIVNITCQGFVFSIIMIDQGKCGNFLSCHLLVLSFFGIKRLILQNCQPEAKAKAIVSHGEMWVSKLKLWFFLFRTKTGDFRSGQLPYEVDEECVLETACIHSCTETRVSEVALSCTTPELESRSAPLITHLSCSAIAGCYSCV